METDAGIFGYGESVPDYTRGQAPDEAVARVRGRNPAEFLGDDSLGSGLRMAPYDVVGRALEVQIRKLIPLPQVRPWHPFRSAAGVAGPELRGRRLWAAGRRS